MAYFHCSEELSVKLQLLESKLLHGEQHGGLDKLAKEKEAQIRQQQQELRKQKEQVGEEVAQKEVSSNSVH